MIEGIGIETHDIRISPLVLAVAAPTGLDLVWRQTAMKTFPRLHVGCESLVACKAELPFRPAIEGAMAMAALRFGIGAAFDQWSRAHELFEVDCEGPTWEKENEDTHWKRRWKKPPLHGHAFTPAQ